jgi:hypothetical protein
MASFALSERWNGWTDLDVVLKAARAAAEAGPLDPLVCEIEVEWDEDTSSIASFDALAVLLASGEQPQSVDIWIAYAEPDEANLSLVFNGRWLQINGAGTDWERSRNAYYAAQVELALAYGITTFRLPKLPKDTVQETRRRLEKPQG